VPRAIISTLSEHFLKEEKDDSQLTTCKGHMMMISREPEVNKVEREFLFRALPTLDSLLPKNLAQIPIAYLGKEQLNPHQFECWT
jgi:hypothetical protein